MNTLTNIQQLERNIEDKQGEIATAQSNIETFEFSCTEEQFNEFLNGAEQSITICGMEFSPSDILKNCDPIAYRCEKADYESNFDPNDVEEYQTLVASLDELESQLDELQSELDDLDSED
jgi:chromosome segregation ATPase